MGTTKRMERLKALGSVLSQTRDVICDVHQINEAEAFKRTEAFIKDNSEKWRSLNPQINYEDPFCRMAYLYMNVAVHATLVEQAMGSYPDIRKTIESKARASSDLQICVLGGGPGSELLGIVRYIQGLTLNVPCHLDLVLVDRIKQWDESWHALKSGIDQQLKRDYGDDRSRWPVSISRSFLPLDVTRAEDFEHFATRFANTDIFLISYLVSELKSSPKEFEKVLGLLMKRASPEAFVMFIDRDEGAVRNVVEQIIAGIPSLVSLGVTKVRGRLEDKLEDLGEWYINLPSLPRQQWLAFFHLARQASIRIVATN